MTPNQKLKQKFIGNMVESGFLQDRWGHFKVSHTMSGAKTVYRFKIKKRVVRLERKIGSRWSLRKSYSFKDISKYIGSNFLANCVQA